MLVIKSYRQIPLDSGPRRNDGGDGYLIAGLMISAS